MQILYSYRVSTIKMSEVYSKVGELQCIFGDNDWTGRMSVTEAFEQQQLLQHSNSDTSQVCD